MKLNKPLSLVALSVIGSLQIAHAAPVYTIENLADLMDQSAEAPKGTLDGTRNGYGLAVNDQDEMVGIAKGKKKLSTADIDDDGIIDIEDGIADEERITFSIDKAIEGNNFTFTAGENASNGAWLPLFDSVNGTTDPSDTDVVNSVDTYYYDINNAGIKVGAMTAPEQTLEYTGDNTDQDFWYFREYEQRGVIKTADAEVEVIPPYVQYVNEDDETETALVGGFSTVVAINQNNLTTGYASTDMSNSGKSQVDNCFDDSETLPLDICVQDKQFPDDNTGARKVQYQTRAFVWQLEGNEVVATQLPLGLEPSSSSTTTYIAQGLGINTAGTVAGRSHVYRNGNRDRLRVDAGYWSKDADGVYQYNDIEMDKDFNSSIAYDINDDGILVGSYYSYLEGFLRHKFFYYDTQADNPEVITPNDFFSKTSDRESKPKDINNQGQVVGFVDTTSERDGKPRPKAGFLFDVNTLEFSNINKIMTCDSRGYVADGDGWKRQEISVSDDTGDVLTYEADIYVVEATSINENGTIVGTAFVRKPTYKTDDNGDLELGENGGPLFDRNANGEPVTSYLPRMVVLKPTNSGEGCSEVDGTEDEPFVRKGAATFAWLFALPLVWLRRRKHA
ncbi:DUF3466 family protein [Shewanella gelidii]|uniref:DUF3466 family protein n=1 Tax=Shewanella gelidii TaxID=1642821 RepID=A0A917ND10_9GAMM|nr:DUF3466 family protein [Shewanella gelidii]MCL1099079.1 DUF3466 family protein [Shewanella gelidii]GGI88337.1 hypothetical protein GCM10009332_27160 [Shewanella gelidii]